MDTRKQSPVLEDTPARDKLPKAPRIHSPQFGPHFEYRLGFRSEIEGFLGLVIVDPVHSVSIVEQRGRSLRPVGRDPLKSSVQAGRKVWVVLVNVDEIRWPLWMQVMAFQLQAASRPRLGKFLP